MDVEAYQADASLFDSKNVIYPFIADPDIQVKRIPSVF